MYDELILSLLRHLNLPTSIVASLDLGINSHLHGLPSSYKLGQFAQRAISLSGLTASLIHTTRTGKPPNQTPKVTVPLKSAVAEFLSERLCFQNGNGVTFKTYPIGGLHPCKDGRWVRIHDGWEHHREAALKVLGLGANATREEVDEKTKSWEAEKLESECIHCGAVVGMARRREEWEGLGTKRTKYPVDIKPLSGNGIENNRVWWKGSTADKPLTGLRVLDLTRVLAGPVAGRTLATYGAEVLWITSPNLPALPDVDRDTARGKKSIHLDLKNANDIAKFWKLVEEADVVLQAYRPEALAGLGITVEELVARNAGLVIANLSAYGETGVEQWKGRRGFDSIVQTVSGMNISEAEHSNSDSLETSGAHAASGDSVNNQQVHGARPLPCQALDHGSGYFLASGIMAALYNQMIEPEKRPWTVSVTLAGTMEYLSSLGQLPGLTGFEPEVGLIDLKPALKGEDDEILETNGDWKYVKHAASIEGVRTGWETMPTTLGSDEPKWSN
jgi:hypothetical protein